jgi:hypothetical protein
MSQKNWLCMLNLSAPRVVVVCPARRRLAEAFVRLQEIDLARAEWNDPQYGQALEDRVVWRELLDLELQDIDERIEEMLATAGREPA